MEIGILIILFAVAWGIVHFAKQKPKSRKRKLPSALRNTPQIDAESQSQFSAYHSPPRRNVSYPPRHTSSRPSNSADDLFRKRRYLQAHKQYLKENKLYRAALSLLLLGPEYASEAAELIYSKNPAILVVTVRNLVKELYQKYKKPATCAALYRSIGFVDEALAIEVANGLQDTSRFVVKVISPPSLEARTDQPATEVDQVPISQTPPEFVKGEEEKQVVTKSKMAVSTPPQKMSNPTQTKIATSSLDERCLVCKKEIKVGDSYVNCPHCLFPGHRGHVLEWVKAMGKCRNCGEKLRLHDFEE